MALVVAVRKGPERLDRPAPAMKHPVSLRVMFVAALREAGQSMKKITKPPGSG